MFSRMVEDRERLFERLDRIISALIPEIAKRRSELLTPHLRPGETLPDDKLELEILLRHFEHRVRELRRTFNEYRDQTALLKYNRQRCDKAASDLYDALKRVRRTIEAAHGTGAGSKILGLKGRTRRKLRALLKQAAGARSRLRGLIEAVQAHDAPEEEAELRAWWRS